MENKNLLNKAHQTKVSWEKVQIEMKEKFGKDIFESWLRKISFVEEFNNYILLSVSTRFIRDWITSRYLDQILLIVKSYKPEIHRIELSLDENKQEFTNNVNNKNINFSKDNVSFIKDFFFQYNRIDPNRNFDNFITGSSNKLAFEASKKVSENISSYNPLYIYGGVGLGKTHLLNAIGLSLQNDNNVMFISAERFMYHFIKSIKKNDMVNFKDFFRKSSVFIIDDIQFIRGKESLQEEFFHTFNSLIEKNSQIIISSDRSPMKLDRVQERIKSRLSGGLIVDIDAPDLDLKIKIIKTKLISMQNQFKENINISDEVITFIANECKTNIRELIGILNRLIAFSRIHKKTLTIIDCKKILKDVFNQVKLVTVDKIQNTVSSFFNIPLSEMLSQRRSRPLARPRQIAMYLAKKLTTRSLPEIGRRFANRDHTTVIHAVKTITRLSEKDQEMKKNIEQIKDLLVEE